MAKCTDSTGKMHLVRIVSRARQAFHPYTICYDVAVVTFVESPMKYFLMEVRENDLLPLTGEDMGRELAR